MRKLIKSFVGLAAFFPLFAFGGEIDGKSPFLCSLFEGIVCTANGECQADDPTELNMPQFVSIDPQKMLISGERPDGTGASSEIQQHYMEGDSLMLLGIDRRTWAASINRKSGKLVATATEDGAAYIIFGACIQQ